MQGRLSLGVSRGAPKEEVIGGSGRAGGRGGGGANPGAMGGKKKKPAGGGLRTGEVARGRMAAGQRPIAESTRLDVVAALLRFREAGGEQELAFPPGLSNDDRALVHQECRKYGFTSKSYGKGEARFVRVSKPRAPGGPGGGGSAPPASWLPLPPPACRALADLFARDPLSAAEAEALAAEARAGAGGAGGGGGGRGAPSPHPAAAAAPGEGAAAAGRRGKRKGKGGGAGAAPDPARAENFPPERVARELAALRARRRPDVEGPRARLPIAEHRARIVEAVGRHRVVLVAGATGCGKTTQVPQYLLEAEWEAGRACRVVCTQPRRLSAVSVADRIATEMGEPVGRSVGYSIRLEGRGGPESSVVFCTNGVLLRQLTQTGGLAASGGRGGAVAGATHLIVDEIHERDKFADFLLVILRDLLAADPGLRVVLMSATMQMGLFSQYFGGCPVVEVPGFVYPVEQLYLDDIVPEVYAASPAAAASARGAVEAPAEMQEAIMQAFLQGSDAAFARLLELAGAAAAGAPPSASPGGAAAPLVNARHRETGATALMVAAGKGRAAEVSVLMANGADPELRSRDGGRAVDWATRFGHFAVAEALLQCAEALAHVQRTAGAAQELSRYQMAANPEEVDLDLVARILRHVALQSADAAATQRRKGQIGPGAALVFLPGWDEISRLKDLLEASPPFSDAARFRVLPLHSMVPSAEQRKVFQSPGPGVMKIVLATNIAETAVTIDDIVYVINSGRHKEKSYDAYTAVSTLQTAWISQASAQQRKGRAGRCRPGVCFHLYSRARSEGLDEFQLPELKRTPLEEIGLQIKVMQEKSGGADSIAAFLAKAVEPPAAKAVENAVDLLRAIGALAPEGEALTELGRHLAAFPLPPQVGKMLLFGSLFGCLDPVLTAACAAAYRDPWVIPVDTRARRAADAARSGAAQRGGGGGRDGGGVSDHLGTVQAFAEWRQAKARGWEWKFCQQGFLNNATLSMLDRMRGQLLKELRGRGVAPGGLERASARGARSPGLVRAVLGCGLYPMVGEVRTVDAGSQGSGRDAAKVNMTVRSGEKVRVHPRSVASKMNVVAANEWGDYRPLLCFQELTRGEALLHVKECTRVPALAVVLVAGSLRVEVDEDSEGLGKKDEPQNFPPSSTVVVDGWLRYRVPDELLPWLLCLRRRLKEAFARLVDGTHPCEIGGVGGRAVDAAAAMLEVISS